MANPSQEIKYNQLFINNQFVDAKSGRKFATLNPATGKKIADVAEADKADVDLAVQAAKKAFAWGSQWRQMTPAARGLLITKLADLIERDAKILANIETQDNGKPYSDALLDVQYTVDTLKYYAGYCDKYYGETIPASGPGGLVSMTKKEPVGVVGQIIPWNYPLLMLAWKWGPALATGCTIVLKPAEQTPLSALYVAALAKEAGLPAGVVNVVPGYGPTAGTAVANHPDIAKVAFTGSVEVGKLVTLAAAQSNLKRVSLELGGKSPLIVLNDADLEEAVEIAYNAAFANHGQNCCAGSRTFVQEELYEKFVQKAIAKAKARQVGNPFEAGVEQGPQIDEAMYKKVLNYIEIGKQEGAKLECGGKAVGSSGYFIEPAVFSNVKDEMKIAKEEIFGPVQCILKFKTLEEVIQRANNTKYGLASGVVTKDLNKAMLLSEAIQAGSVWINCYDAVIPQAPFGGYKMSGIGRELGKDGLENYLETKTVTIKLNPNVL